MHQDAVYVAVGSPMEFAASWIALEDIRPGSGELEYYDRSHSLEPYLFQGRYKRMPPNDPEHETYLQSLHEAAARKGLARVRFRAAKGDALMWCADLAHGGSRVENPALSRRSLVTHYCPRELDPAYFRQGRHTPKIPFGRGYYCHAVRR